MANFSAKETKKISYKKTISIEMVLCFLALMVTASSCGGVCHKRYSEQQELAPESWNNSG